MIEMQEHEEQVQVQGQEKEDLEGRKKKVTNIEKKKSKLKIGRKGVRKVIGKDA